MDYQKRLAQAIPGGAHTYSRGDDQYPSNCPPLLARGSGAYVWDANGNKYVDYGMGLRSVTLGYSNEAVNNSAINQINMGNNLTRPSMVELQSAELFIKTIPPAEMVKFAKNGSNVTTAAIKLARGFTNKNYIAVPRQHPFFSFDDWFISQTPIKKGIPKESSKYTLLFDYGDMNSVNKLFEDYPNQIAAIMLEPATSITPSLKEDVNLSFSSNAENCPRKENKFLKELRNKCTESKALLIFDEMITGFRWNIKGAGFYFNVNPDLMTFGKGMANGFSVSAIAGKREIMELGSINKEGQERTFLLSTTHGAEMCGLGAFIETVNQYKKNDVCDYLWTFGEELKSSINKISKELDIYQYFRLTGPSICLNFKTLDQNLNPSLAFRTLFMQEMISNKVIMPWISISFSHTKKELNLTLEAVRNSLIVYKKALGEGLDKYLNSSIIKPVFRSHN